MNYYIINIGYLQTCGWENYKVKTYVYNKNNLL